jgi:threonine/homoserine/homoserine lactone efflux protein
MFGIEAADLTHMLAAVLGVSTLLAASELGYDLIRYAGAAYLIGLGIFKLLQSTSPANEAPLAARHQRLFWQGYLVQILNPKPALFFAAFLPQFIDPAGSVAVQLVVLGIVYLVVAIASDFAYVLLAGVLGGRLADSGRKTLISRISAGTYFALGLLAALVGARPAKAGI